MSSALRLAATRSGSSSGGWFPSLRSKPGPGGSRPSRAIPPSSRPAATPSSTSSAIASSMGGTSSSPTNSSQDESAAAPAAPLGDAPEQRVQGVLDARGHRALAPPQPVDEASDRREVGLAGELVPSGIEVGVLLAQLTEPASVLEAVRPPLRRGVAAGLRGGGVPAAGPPPPPGGGGPKKPHLPSPPPPR